MLDRDIVEARFRAQLVRTLSSDAEFGDVARAARLVVALLGNGAKRPAPGYGEAIEALSVAIDEAQANL